MPFLDRSGRASRSLEWKVRIFTLGAVLALVGVYLDERWLTGIAIVVLFSGMMLHFGRPPDAGPEGESEPDGEERR